MIRELEAMCLRQEFDRAKAEQLMRQVDVNQVFAVSGYRWKTVLLECAATHANVPMVELLLRNGADPNLIFDDEATLWNLQYNDGETDDENEQRLIIAQMLLEYGADPLIDPENGGESLLDYVVFAVFNDDYSELWEYRSRFLILLVAYGAKSDYCSPRIVKEFDKANMRQYHFLMVPAGNGKFSGAISDGRGNNIAYI